MLRAVLALMSTSAVFWVVLAVPIVLGLIALGAAVSSSRKGGDGS